METVSEQSRPVDIPKTTSSPTVKDTFSRGPEPVSTGYSTYNVPRNFVLQPLSHQFPLFGGWRMLSEALPSITPLSPYSHIAIPFYGQHSSPLLPPTLPYHPIRKSAPMDPKKPEQTHFEGLGIDLNFSNLVTTPTPAPVMYEQSNNDHSRPNMASFTSSGIDIPRSIDDISEPSSPSRHLLVDCSHLDLSLGVILQLLSNFQDTKCIFTDRILSDGIAVVSFFDVRHAMSSLQKMQNELGWTAHYYDGRCLELVTSKEFAIRAREFEADLLCCVKPKIGSATTDAMVYRALTTFGPVWNLSRVVGTEGLWFWVKFYDCRQCKVVLETKTALIDGMVLEFKASELAPIELSHEDIVGLSSPIATESTFSPSSLGSMSGFIGPRTSFDGFSPSIEPTNIFQSQPRVLDKENVQSISYHLGSSPSKEGNYGSHINSPYEYRGLFLEESPSKNAINLEKIALGQDTRTTIMLRNIPNKVDQATLKDFVDETSRGMYNFLYLRIDFKNLCNVGYAFINFIDPLDIISFVKARGGKRWNKYNSEKVLDVTYANIQGIDGLIEKFRNSSVMDQAESFRPKLFYSNGPLRGMEMEFPPANNLNRKLRSINAAQHVGLFTPKNVSPTANKGSSPWRK